VLTAKNDRTKLQDNAYVEQIEGVFESGVARRNTRENFFAPQQAFKERALSQLVEEMVDFFKCPVWSRKSDGKHAYL
jgi:hypothetical protein